MHTITHKYMYKYLSTNALTNIHECFVVTDTHEHTHTCINKHSNNTHTHTQASSEMDDNKNSGTPKKLTLNCTAVTLL